MKNKPTPCFTPEEKLIQELRAINEKLLKALKEMVEVHDDECWTDHHGYCQAHNLDDVNNGGCRVANAKAVIAEVEKLKGGL